MKEEIDEDVDEVEVRQFDLLQKAFNGLCRDENPHVIVNGEKIKVVNIIMDGKDVRLLALNDNTKHLEIGSTVTLSEKDQKSVEMIVESHKLGCAWLKRK